MRRPINSVNGFYKDPNLPYSAQDALNVLPMMAEKGGTRTLSKLVDAPGLKPFVRIGVNDGVDFTPAGAGRGMRVVDNKLFVVAGRNLWQITASGVSINHGTIPGVARVSMAHNQRGLGNELAIDNGQARYVFNTQTQLLQKVTDESFPGSFKAVFIDGYIVYVEPQGRYFGHSDLSNALSYNSFDEYEAEGQPDRIVTAHESNRELLIAGQDTIEPYVNSPSGSGEAPFVRATNTVIKSGCSARDSFCDVGQFTVYLDQNRVVQVLNGYTPVAISTSVVDSALQSCTKQQIANAYAFAVEAEGFLIYYLTVPGKFTFGYDFKNREWHRRASNGLEWWAVTDVVQWNGDWIALDSRTGELFKLRWRDYPFDGQQELVREWVTGVFSADQNPVFVHELELLFGCGGQAYDPVDFPEQPEGPTISGTLPDGAMGQMWAGGTFTATGGTPPYRFVSRPGTEHVGNLGPMSAIGVVPAEIPNAIGSGVEVARVIDANGLYDETEATYTIAPAMLAIRTRNESAANYGDYLQGGAGSSWGGSWVQYSDSTPADPQYIKGIGSRFVAWTQGANPRYTDDVGATWTDCGGDEISIWGGVRQGCVFDQTMLIAGGIGSIARSTDGGQTFNNVSDSPAAYCVSGVEENVVSVFPPTLSSSHSVDGGETWSSSTYPTGLLASTAWVASDFAAGAHYVGGSKTGPVPVLFRSAAGVVWEELTLPFVTATCITVVQKVTMGGEETIMLGTDSGELAYLDPADDTVKLSSDSIGVYARGACFNGVVCSVIGSSGGTGVIAHTTDFDEWTVGRTEATVGGEWFGVAAQEAGDE